MAIDWEHNGVHNGAANCTQAGRARKERARMERIQAEENERLQVGMHGARTLARVPVRCRHACAACAAVPRSTAPCTRPVQAVHALAARTRVAHTTRLALCLQADAIEAQLQAENRRIQIERANKVRHNARAYAGHMQASYATACRGCVHAARCMPAAHMRPRPKHERRAPGCVPQPWQSQ